MNKQELELKLSKNAGWQTRNKRIKYSNFEVWVDDNGKLNASSYGWWAIISNKIGLYFFNWYSYSNTTRKHQYKLHKIVQNLGIDYISVAYSEDLDRINIETILQDKINSLYTGENKLATSRATKYTVYSADEFNQTLSDIRKIAAAMKLPEKKLEKMLLVAELYATTEMLTELCDEHTRKTTIKEMRASNNNLSAIQL